MLCRHGAPQCWWHWRILCMWKRSPSTLAATIGLAVTSAPLGVRSPGLRQTVRLTNSCVAAELALDRARGEKKLAMAIYEAGVEARSARGQLSLLGELRHAVENNELQLYFQPKIELATQSRRRRRKCCLRWQHPTQGYVLGPAEAFIPFAEQTGFIRRVTRWTLETRHRWRSASRWHRDGKTLPSWRSTSAPTTCRRCTASIHVSPASLSRHQLPPALLTLELTESGFIEDPARSLGACSNAHRQRSASAFPSMISAPAIHRSATWRACRPMRSRLIAASCKVGN